MVINKKSWHYQLYKFTYFWSEQVPAHTNLCQYVQRILWGTPFWGVMALILGCLLAVILLGAVIFGPIFGYLPRTLHPTKFFDNDMYHYQGLKLGRSYNAFQVYPWHVLLAIIIVGFHVMIHHYWGWHPLSVEFTVIGAIVALIALVVGVLLYLDSSTGKVINEYLAAKKQRVCPVVEFTNKE